jgi:transcriptional regulator with XRE-family HTH domain
MTNLDTMTTLAKNIRHFMRRKGMRQQDLADATGIHRPNISRLLTNPDANPQLSAIEEIANALDVKVCDLFAEIPEKVAC